MSGFCSNPCIVGVTILLTFGAVKICTTDHTPNNTIPVLYSSDGESNTFPLFCLRNIGVKLCLKMCEAYDECDVVHFNRETLTCELRTEFDENNFYDWTGILLKSHMTSLACFDLIGGQSCFHVNREWCNEVSIDDKIATVNFSSFWQSTNETLNKYKLHSESCWTANASESWPYVKAYYDKKYWMTSVVTQGRADHAQWVKSYYVMTLYNERYWTYQTERKWYYILEWKRYYTGTKLFPGNFDQNTSVENKLSVPVYTSGLGIAPNEFYNYRSMRFGVKGIGTIFT